VTLRIVRELGADCRVESIDVRDQASLDAAVAVTVGTFGHLDIVIANAGIMHSQPFWEIDEQSWQAVLDVNLSGVWRTAKAAAPQMIEQGGGVIIATGSVQSRTARRHLSAYTASKHGLSGLLKTMALELGPFNVRVNSVLPGAIHTPMIDNDSAGAVSAAAGATDARTLYFRRMAALRNRSVLPAASVAYAVSWLASDEAAHVTGVELPVDAGSLVLPGLNYSPVIDPPDID
jgi:NAD(P)-dependent dehydrogenase (short-subunit alcohol dehydrogenase family)